MPHTLALLTRGEVDEWTATLLVRETAILCLEDRRLVDARLCAMSIETETGAISQPWAVGQTPRRVEGAARALAAELDPQAAVRRAAKAAGDRRVTIRPAPDTMTYLTTLLPVAQGVAAWASLSKAALRRQGRRRRAHRVPADGRPARATDHRPGHRRGRARRDPAGDDPRHPARRLRPTREDRRRGGPGSRPPATSPPAPTPPAGCAGCSPTLPPAWSPPPTPLRRQFSPADARFLDTPRPPLPPPRLRRRYRRPRPRPGARPTTAPPPALTAKASARPTT